MSDAKVLFQVSLEPEIADRINAVRVRLGIPATEILRRILIAELPRLEAAPAPLPPVDSESLSRAVSRS